MQANPIEVKSSALTPDVRAAIEFGFRVTYHEAGHAIVALALNVDVDGIYIDDPSRGVSKFPHVARADIAPFDIAKRTAIKLAGYLAERRVIASDRRAALEHASGDFADLSYSAARAEAMGYPMFPNEKTWPAYVLLHARLANHALRLNWSLLEDMAAALFEGDITSKRALNYYRKRVNPCVYSAAYMRRLESLCPWDSDHWRT